MHRPFFTGCREMNCLLSSVVELWFCKPAVVRSNRTGGFASWFRVSRSGEVPKRSNGADCKSAVVSLHRFKSCSPHFSRGCSSMVERQPSKLNAWVRFPSPALRAAVAQLVECILGKDEVAGSNPASSSDAHVFRRVPLMATTRVDLASRIVFLFRSRPFFVAGV